VLLASAALPTAAHAGAYELSICHTASGTPIQTPNGLIDAVNASFANFCGQTGGEWDGDLVVTSNNAAKTGVRYSVPSAMPTAKIVRVRSEVAFAPKSGDAGYYGTYATAAGGWISTVPVPGGNWSSGGYVITDAGITADNGTRATSAEVVIACPSNCGFSGVGTMRLRRSMITFEDPTPPADAVAERTGLLDGTPQGGTRTLHVTTASDADTGVKLIDLYTASGTKVASVVDNSRLGGVLPQTTPVVNDAEARVDTSKLPDGSNALELWTTDYAGNVRKTALGAITVANGGAATAPGPGGTSGPAGSPTPAARVAAKVTLSLSASKLRRRGSVKFTGKVAPAPAKGTRVVLEAKKGKRWITAAIVKTRDGGAYQWSHRFTHRGTLHLRARLLDGDATVAPGFSKTKTLMVR
jgi:hypothetical protein